MLRALYPIPIEWTGGDSDTLDSDQAHRLLEYHRAVYEHQDDLLHVQVGYLGGFETFVLAMSAAFLAVEQLREPHYAGPALFLLGAAGLGLTVLFVEVIRGRFARLRYHEAIALHLLKGIGDRWETFENLRKRTGTTFRSPYALVLVWIPILFLLTNSSLFVVGLGMSLSAYGFWNLNPAAAIGTALFLSAVGGSWIRWRVITQKPDYVIQKGPLVRG